MPQEIVLASNNPGKLKELAAILAPYRVTLYPLQQFSAESAEETGVTFHENALIKARFAATKANLPAIADDSGLEVDALGAAPGVYSARYAGAGATDQANNEKLLAALKNVPAHLRRARFQCVLAFVTDAHSEPVFATGTWEGRILNIPRGGAGFGYDPLFLPDDCHESAAEMTAEQKNLRSHRAQALQALARQLFPKA